MPTDDAPKTTIYSEEEEEDSDEEDNWYPGDGICPPMNEFNAVYQATLDTWSSAALSQARRNSSDPLCIEPFLELLKNVPCLLDQRPSNFELTGPSKNWIGFLDCCLELGTTEDPRCDQPVKLIDYYQVVALSRPQGFKPWVKPETNLPGIEGFQAKASRLTTIVLAWSYIISCRWVEILQQAGFDASLRHVGSVEVVDCFWDLVVESRWDAQTQARGGTWYSPWMFRNIENAESNGDMVSVQSDSSLAFDILLEFCISEKLESEFFSGLVVILMLSSRNAPHRKLAPPMTITRPATAFTKRATVFDRLLRSLDKCMTLSATLDALDSVLCSAFFDPGVPCNLSGAQALGIEHALQVKYETEDYSKLLNAISEITPHLAILWNGVVCSGQARILSKQGIGGSPSPMPVAAFWTNTRQSFLQVIYEDERSTANSMIPRSNEFSLTFFCRPKVRSPFTSAPPFGWTTPNNLSLEVREHYSHAHRPIWWRCNWVLRPNELTPAGEKHYLDKVVRQVPRFVENPDVQSSLEPDKQKRADNFSGGVTSTLFNWHRDHDDGLWLDDGTAKDIESIRRLQQHQWIKYPWDDDDRVLETKEPSVDRERVLEWCSNIE